MSKPHKVDFQALIASDVAPAIAAAPANKTKPALAEIVELTRETRQGTLKQRTRQQSLYLEVPVYEALRETAHTERTSLHALYLEGIDAVLKKRGLPSIAEMMKASEPVVLSSQDEMPK